MDVRFLTSGGPEQGMGHVYKSVALASTLDDGVVSSFIVTAEGPAVDFLREQGYEPSVVPSQKEVYQELGSQRMDALVIDHPSVSESFLSDIRDSCPAARLIVVGNRLTTIPANTGEYADVVVDFSTHLDTFRTESHMENGTRYLEGIGYLVLRPSFGEYEQSWESDSDLERVMIMFGGSDPANHTTWAVQELTEWDECYVLDICIGPGFRHEEELHAALEPLSEDLYDLNRNVTDVPRRMQAADVLLTSPGLSKYEGLFVGCPVVALFQTDNHRTTYDEVPFTHDPEVLDSLVETMHATFERFLNDGPDVRPGERIDDLIDAVIDQS